MKIKLGKTMMVSILAAALIGCNSGGASNGNPNSAGNTSNTSIATTQNVQATEGQGGILNIISGNIEEAITEQVGSMLWNLITTGEIKPQTAAEWDKQALISIQKNIQQIENTLNQENTKLNMIINDIDQTTLENSDLKISDYLSSISDTTTDVENLVQDILPANESSTVIVDALITGNAQPFTSEQIAALTARVNNSNVSNIVPEYTSTEIDITEQQLSCDSPNNSATYYVLNNPTVNTANHPTPNLSTKCLVSIALNNAYNELTQNIALTGGSNIFYNLQGYDQMLDTQYLTIVQALTTAYYLDQLRLYLYVNLKPSSQNHIAPLLTVDPNSNNLADLATAQSELQLAYNTRLGFLQTLFKQAKQQAFNNYAGAIPSPSLQNNCNFSYQTIESNIMTQAMSDNSNLYGWDGSQLRMTCQSQQPQANSGEITTNTNVAKLCNSISGSYNLQSSNGYIRCGVGNAGNVYGNYSESNINSAPQPTAFFQLYNLYQNIPDYDGANDNELNYNLAEKDGSGNLWINFNGQALQFYQYNGYDNNGIQATFNNPTNSFIDIFVNSYVSGGAPSAATSQWSYVDDGQHAYLISASWLGENGDFPRPVIMCLPNDSNCTQGYFPNNSGEGLYPNGPTGYGTYQALIFSNGDEITMSQLLGHGDYDIQTFYNGASTPIEISGHNPEISFANVTYNN